MDLETIAEAFQVNLVRVEAVMASQAVKNLAKLQGTLSTEDLRRFFPLLEEPASGKMTVASFFSGCGGLDLGFQQAGYQLSYANDIFGSACLTYSRNIGPIDPRSIYDVKESEVPKTDVLLAGFPCQPFSNAGSRKGKADPRGTLFWETLRFVDKYRPKVLVFENVRGILSMLNEDGTRLIDGIEDEIRSRGYRVNHALVNTADHGVPQNRHRVLIVGFREDVSTKEFDFESIEKAQGKTIQEVLALIPENAENKVDWKLSPQALALIEHIPEGGSWKSVPHEHLPERLRRIKANMDRYHSPNFYRRFKLTEVMGTITAAATPENSGIVHSTENRRFSVREVAGFQTFPNNFVFEGISISNMYKQIGNAVPVEFARRLAIAIDNSLTKVKS